MKAYKPIQIAVLSMVLALPSVSSFAGPGISNTTNYTTTYNDNSIHEVTNMAADTGDLIAAGAATMGIGAGIRVGIAILEQLMAVGWEKLSREEKNQRKFETSVKAIESIEELIAKLDSSEKQMKVLLDNENGRFDNIGGWSLGEMLYQQNALREEYIAKRKQLQKSNNMCMEDYAKMSFYREQSEGIEKSIKDLPAAFKANKDNLLVCEVLDKQLDTLASTSANIRKKQAEINAGMDEIIKRDNESFNKFTKQGWSRRIFDKNKTLQEFGHNQQREQKEYVKTADRLVKETERGMEQDANGLKRKYEETVDTCKRENKATDQWSMELNGTSKITKFFAKIFPKRYAKTLAESRKESGFDIDQNCKETALKALNIQLAQGQDLKDYFAKNKEAVKEKNKEAKILRIQEIRSDLKSNLAQVRENYSPTEYQDIIKATQKDFQNKFHSLQLSMGSLKTKLESIEKTRAQLKDLCAKKTAKVTQISNWHNNPLYAPLNGRAKLGTQPIPKRIVLTPQPQKPIMGKVLLPQLPAPQYAIETNIQKPMSFSVTTPAPPMRAAIQKPSDLGSAKAVWGKKPEEIISTVCLSDQTLAKKQFPEKYGRIMDFYANTASMKIESRTLIVKNDSDAAPLLDGAVQVCEALKNLLQVEKR